MARATYKSLLEDLRHNDPRSFRFVLETEGLPKDSNWYDYDLLMRAIRMNRKRIVIHLLNKRCRVNKPERLCNGENTPLHLVAEKLGWCDVIEKMLQLKARVTDQNADGNTPLHLAFLSRRSTRIVSLLLQHHVKEYPGDVVNNDGLGFMHIACTRSDYKSVQKFFDTGLSDFWSRVSMESNSIYAGYSCLHFAVEASKHDTANFLCQYEADVYAQDRNGSTPLHFALMKRDTAMIDILCYYDSKNENYVNDFGVSHLMAACAGFDFWVAKEYLVPIISDKHNGEKILNQGVAKDGETTSEYSLKGFTPLHFAAMFGRVENILCLLHNGADCCALTCYQKTPAQLATENEHEDVADIINAYCQSNCKVARLVSEISKDIAKTVLSN